VLTYLVPIVLSGVLGDVMSIVLSNVQMVPNVMLSNVMSSLTSVLSSVMPNVLSDMLSIVLSNVMPSTVLPNVIPNVLCGVWGSTVMGCSVWLYQMLYSNSLGCNQRLLRGILWQIGHRRNLFMYEIMTTVIIVTNVIIYLHL